MCTKSPRKSNAVIKLQTDETSHVSAGVKGAALAPLAQKSQNLKNLKTSQKSLPLLIGYIFDNIAGLAVKGAADSV